MVVFAGPAFKRGTTAAVANDRRDAGRLAPDWALGATMKLPRALGLAVLLWVALLASLWSM
jgi:hypothetical protein